MDRWNNATGREIGQSSSSSQETAQRVFVALRRGDLIADPHNDSRDYYNGGYGGDGRSEEHTSELQSLMRISYAVFCLKKTNINISTKKSTNRQTQIVRSHATKKQLMIIR